MSQIVIAGGIGVGKSSTLKLLALHMNTVHRDGRAWRTHSASAIFRKMAQERYPKLDADGAATLFAKHTKKHPEMDVDGLIDRELVRVGQEENHVIVECRLACFFPEAFRVRLFADDELVVQRVAKERGMSVDSAREKVGSRNADDLARYKSLYPWISDFRDQFQNPSQGWHLEINTGTRSHIEVVSQIYEHWLSWQSYSPGASSSSGSAVPA